MGTRMAPSYANIFMYYIEEEIPRLSPHKLMFYVRFIDDIFMIWDKGLDNLQTFFNLANSFHPSIKFTFDYSLK